MGDDTWAGLAKPFADDAYATVKGQVRTQVMHQQLLAHLPRLPATASSATLRTRLRWWTSCVGWSPPVGSSR